MTRRHLPAAALALVAACAAPASAQRPDTVPPLGLDTVTVRVLRTPVPARRAPYAVSAVDSTALRRGRAGVALAEGLASVPGVQVDNRWNWAVGERIAVRGFGARAQFGVRGVRVLVDGIPATLPDGQTTLNHVDPGSLGRAEVVRGPASALYGNAAGGVIHLETEAAPPVPLASEYRVGAGSGGLLRLQSVAAGRRRGLDYRASITRLRVEGWREHAWARQTHLSATLGWRGRRDDVRLLLNAVDYDALNPGSLTDSAARAAPRRAFAGNVDNATGEEGRQSQAGVRWTRAVGRGGLEVTGHALRRTVDNPIPGRIIDLRRGAGGLRAAFSSTLPVGGDGLRWTAGAETELQRDRRRNFVNVGGDRGALALDQKERVTTAAGFAHAALPLGPLEVMAALRYDRARFAVDDRFAGAGNPDDSGERTMHAWSPTAGASLTLAPVLTVYANVATAFETPTTTELANRADGAGGFNPELEPQRTVSYEGGAKGRLGRAGYALAAYRANVRDALIPFEVPDVPGRQFFRNAGSARHQGVEAGIVLPAGAGLGGRLSYARTDARFRDYTVRGTQLAGKRVPGVAPHRVDGAVSFTVPGGAFAEVEGRYLDAIPVDDENAFRSRPYALFSLRSGGMTVRLRRLRVVPTVAVENVLDRRHNSSVVVNAFGRRYFEPGPGRTFHVSARILLGGE